MEEEPEESDWTDEDSSSSNLEFEYNVECTDFKPYVFIHVERPKTEKCNKYFIRNPPIRRRLKTAKKSQKPTQTVKDIRRGSTKRIDDEYTDCTSDEEQYGKKYRYTRIVPTMKAFNAMIELLKWENNDRIKTMKLAGYEIKFKGCAQGSKIPDDNPKYTIPGPWVQCYTQHYASSNYGQNEIIPKVPPKRNLQELVTLEPKPFNYLTPKAFNYLTPKAKTGPPSRFKNQSSVNIHGVYTPIPKEIPRCNFCRYISFQHYTEPDMYYQEYLNRVTYVGYGRYRDNGKEKVCFDRVARSLNPSRLTKNKLVIVNEHEFRELLNPEKSRRRRSSNQNVSTEIYPVENSKDLLANIGTRNKLPVFSKTDYSLIKSRYLDIRSKSTDRNNNYPNETSPICTSRLPLLPEFARTRIIKTLGKPVERFKLGMNPYQLPIIYGTRIPTIDKPMIKLRPLLQPIKLPILDPVRILPHSSKFWNNPLKKEIPVLNLHPLIKVKVESRVNKTWIPPEVKTKIPIPRKPFKPNLSKSAEPKKSNLSKSTEPNKPPLLLKTKKSKKSNSGIVRKNKSMDSKKFPGTRKVEPQIPAIKFY